MSMIWCFWLSHFLKILNKRTNILYFTSTKQSKFLVILQHISIKKQKYFQRKIVWRGDNPRTRNLNNSPPPLFILIYIILAEILSIFILSTVELIFDINFCLFLFLCPKNEDDEALLIHIMTDAKVYFLPTKTVALCITMKGDTRI